MKRKMAVIVDMDHTLALNPFQFLDRPGWRWLYYRLWIFSDPNYELMSEIAGKRIVIITGRDEWTRPIVERWLKRHGILVEEMHMRPKGNRLPADKLKPMIAMKASDRFWFTAAYDDSVPVCKAYANISIPAYTPPLPRV